MKKFLILSIILLSLYSCKFQKKISVILISIDNLSPEYLEKTENIKKFARENIYFENCISPDPNCLPSHLSVFTSTTSKKNGCFLNEYYYLKKEIRTISEVFKDKGYLTYSFVSGKPLKKLYGLNRGFDVYDDLFFHGQNGSLILSALEKENITFFPNFREAKETLNLAKEKIEKEKKPFFLFIHLYDLYPPLSPPEEYKVKFPQDPYFASLQYVDYEMGIFLKEINRKDVLIVIISDHGKKDEESPKKETGLKDIRVPAIFKFPEKFNIKPQNFKNPISLLDISPTLLSFLKIKDKNSLQEEGEDLKELITKGIEKKKKIISSTYTPYHFYGKSPLDFEIDKNLNLIEKNEIITEEKDGDFYSFILRAQELLKESKLKEAKYILNQLYQKYQNCYLYLKTLLQAKTQEKDLIGMETVLKKMQEIFGPSPELDFEIYKKYLIFGEKDKGVSFLYEMMQKYQSFPFLVEEALSLEEIRNSDDFKNFVKKIPHPVEDYLKDIFEGIIALFAKNNERALNYFKAAINKGAEMTVPYFQTGMIYKKEGKLKEGLPYLYISYLLSQDNPRFLYELGDTFAILGDFEKAHNFFKKAYLIQPTNFSVAISYLKTAYLLKKIEEVSILKKEILKNYKNQIEELTKQDNLLKEIISSSP